MNVIFDQLRVSDNGERLFIDLHVSLADYFDHFYLKSLTITTADKVPEAIQQGDAAPNEFFYKKFYPAMIDAQTGKVTGSREDHLIIDKNALIAANPYPREGTPISGTYYTYKYTGSFSGPLFFVFAEVQVKGGTDECLPCGYDEANTVAVTFDTNLLYQRVMDYTKQFGDNCTIPTGFTDYILLWNAFKASVETEHYIPAIKYYNMLFGIPHESPTRDGSYSPFGGVGPTSKITKPCNCNG